MPGFENQWGGHPGKVYHCWGGRLLFLKKILICLLVLERMEGRERKRDILMWERNISHALTEDWTHNLCMCPDQEWTPTFWYTGQCSKNWATPSRARTTLKGLTCRLTYPRTQCKNTRFKSTDTVYKGNPLTHLKISAEEAGNCWDSLQVQKHWWLLFLWSHSALLTPTLVVSFWNSPINLLQWVNKPHWEPQPLMPQPPPLHRRWACATHTGNVPWVPSLGGQGG